MLETDLISPAVFHFLQYLLGFLAFPFLIVCFLLMRNRKKLMRLGGYFLLILTVLFLWARFIEPQLIIVRETRIETGFSADIVLIADLHLGVYKSEEFLRRTVQRINTIDADAVVIAGDFTYWPSSEEIPSLFAPLAQIEVPVYAVLGNHDVERPGPPVRDALKTVLEQQGVTLLNNHSVQLRDFVLLGLGSNWAGEDDVGMLLKFSEADDLVVLTHNPDTLSRYPVKTADVTLAGHTHCGQIRIPWLYRLVIPTKGEYDKGLTAESNGKLFITCGLGEVGMPMRLFNPPVIDVLRFRE